MSTSPQRPPEAPRGLRGPLGASRRLAASKGGTTHSAASRWAATCLDSQQRRQGLVHGAVGARTGGAGRHCRHAPPWPLAPPASAPRQVSPRLRPYLHPLGCLTCAGTVLLLTQDDPTKDRTSPERSLKGKRCGGMPLRGPCTVPAVSVSQRWLAVHSRSTSGCERRSGVVHASAAGWAPVPP